VTWESARRRIIRGDEPPAEGEGIRGKGERSSDPRHIETPPGKKGWRRGTARGSITPRLSDPEKGLTEN